VRDENLELPDWLGFIDSQPTRSWKYGEVTVGALSAEKIMEWRTTYMSALTGTPGVMFRDLIQRMNTTVSGGIPIHAGEVYEGRHEGEIPTMGNMLEIVKNISKFAGGPGGTRCDFSITGKEDGNGVLELYANLYTGHRGVDTGLWLSENNTRGMEEEMVEEGEIYNYIVCYADAATVNGRSRAVASDETSIGAHGLRVHVYEGVGAERDGLQYQADNFLAQHKEAARVLPVTLLNVNNLYRHVALGNQFYRKSTSSGFGARGIGFEQRVRVTDFEVDDESGEVGASLEVMDV
jgi:hypothetical protein